MSERDDITWRSLASVIIRYNACTEPCDMFVGPCACGAWHKTSDWAREQQDAQRAFEAVVVT
jgi:hypothetical protein